MRKDLAVARYSLITLAAVLLFYASYLNNNQVRQIINAEESQCYQIRDNLQRLLCGSTYENQANQLFFQINQLQGAVMGIIAGLIALVLVEFVPVLLKHA